MLVRNNFTYYARTFYGLSHNYIDVIYIYTRYILVSGRHPTAEALRLPGAAERLEQLSAGGYNIFSYKLRTYYH